MANRQSKTKIRRFHAANEGAHEAVKRWWALRRELKAKRDRKRQTDQTYVRLDLLARRGQP